MRPQTWIQVDAYPVYADSDLTDKEYWDRTRQTHHHKDRLRPLRRIWKRVR